MSCYTGEKCMRLSERQLKFIKNLVPDSLRRYIRKH